MTAGRCVVAVQRVPAEPEALEARLLHAERALLGPRATPRRRAEYAAGRVAAHDALALLRPALPREAVAILRQQGERPRAVLLADRTPLTDTVSITHADGLAMALAADVPAALDLVTLEDHGPGFAREAFAPGELQAWQADLGPRSDEALLLGAAFAFKECALKWLGVGMGEPLHAVRLRPQAAQDAWIPLEVEFPPGRRAALWGRRWTGGRRLLALLAERPDVDVVEPTGGLAAVLARG